MREGAERRVENVEVVSERRGWVGVKCFGEIKLEEVELEVLGLIVGGDW